VVLSALLLFAIGCASVRPEPDYDRARVRVAETVAVDNQAVAVPTDEPGVQVTSRLAGGVSAEEAVEIALLNNKDLQAAFYEIGISRADVVQSGLLSNPSLGGVIRFPQNGGDEAATIEARLAWNLIDLWHRPARKRVQERRLEHKVLEVAHIAARLAARTRAAYVAAVAAEGARLVEEENLASTAEFLELTLALQDAGVATEVEANAARAEHLEQEARLRSASLREFEKKLRLATLLGLDVGPEELVLTSTLAPPPDASLDVEALMASATSHRLDLRAAKENMRAIESEVSLEKRLFLRELNGLVSLESRGDELEIGPGLAMELPLFDRNSAQVTRAELRHQQAQTTLDALTVATRQQVRAAHERLVSTLETARAYRDDIAPLRESSLELAREAFRAGKTGFLSVLEAQKRLLAARRDANAWNEASALMLIELEAACARPLSELLEEHHLR
jgi:cobalt-zinc-cadmium efflux system outer membrane protein